MRFGGERHVFSFPTRLAPPEIGAVPLEEGQEAVAFLGVLVPPCSPHTPKGPSEAQAASPLQASDQGGPPAAS